jgi:hypothetical protein
VLAIVGEDARPDAAEVFVDGLVEMSLVLADRLDLPLVEVLVSREVTLRVLRRLAALARGGELAGLLRLSDGRYRSWA